VLNVTIGVLLTAVQSIGSSDYRQSAQEAQATRRRQSTRHIDGRMTAVADAAAASGW